tara:strand:+ start:350 stop:559 length:210 start_codon:yes stop_codon:yes gene_type:complete
METVLHQLQILDARATKEKSQFKYKINSALTSIEDVVKIYSEVMYRDSTEDYDWKPDLIEGGKANDKDD